MVLLRSRAFLSAICDQASGEDARVEHGAAAAEALVAAAEIDAADPDLRQNQARYRR